MLDYRKIVTIFISEGKEYSEIFEILKDDPDISRITLMQIIREVVVEDLIKKRNHIIDSWRKYIPCYRTELKELNKKIDELELDIHLNSQTRQDAQKLLNDICDKYGINIHTLDINV